MKNGSSKIENQHAINTTHKQHIDKQFSVAKTTYRRTRGADTETGQIIVREWRVEIIQGANSTGDL